MLRRHAFFLFLISLLGAGCGGFSQTGPGTISTPAVPFDQLGTRARLLQDTDKWSYSLSGTVATTSAGTVSVTGDVLMLLDRVAVNGQEFRAISEIFNLNSAAGAAILSSSRYFSQDPTTRQMTTYGVNDNGHIRMFDTPQAPLLKTGNVGDNATQTYTYTDGTTEEQSVAVVGTELVTVAAGKFMTYKVNSVTKTADRTTTSVTWYSRQLGSFVKSDDTTVLSDGQKGVRHLELTSTNVTPSN